jgi:hypothetical protein
MVDAVPECKPECANERRTSAMLSLSEGYDEARDERSPGWHQGCGNRCA